jgi:hypothetical protein
VPYVRKTTSIPKIEVEIDELFASRAIPHFKEEGQLNCPLTWWREMVKKDQWPILQRAARKFLGMTATEAPCERAFNILKNVVTPKRGRLSDANVAMEMFVFVNQKIFIFPADE